MNCSEFLNLLNEYMDGELDDARQATFRQHAEGCESCRSALMDAEQLREILSHLDDEMEVPLSAQAAWRKAVREEARHRRMKRLYSFCGAVAAVCVLVVGITAMLPSGVRGSGTDQGVQVETDGLSDEAEDQSVYGPAMARKSDETITYAGRSVYAEDVEEFYHTLKDIVAEYDGMVTQEDRDQDGVKIYVQLPGENADEFISAVDGLALRSDDGDMNLDASAECVGICVTILPGEGFAG